MAEYVVGKVDDIPENGSIAVQAGRHLVAVFRVRDRFFGLHAVCPHKGGLLCGGEVVADKMMVRCPWHHWNWRIDTGELETDPRQKVRRFEVKVVDDEVVLSA